MIISDTVIAALVAGFVSLVVSVVGVFTIRYQLRHDKMKSESDQKHDYSQQLYEQRVRVYPIGYAITSRIMRRPKPDFLQSVESLRNTGMHLNKWVQEEAGLFMSRDSLKAYWDLRNALSKKPGHGDAWTEEQANKLWNARTIFRRQLRNDIGNLYREDASDSDKREYWETL